MGPRFYTKLPWLLAALAAAALAYYSPAVRTFFYAFSVTVEESYRRLETSISRAYERHMAQAETIARFERERRAFERELLRCRRDAAAYRALADSLGVRDANLSAIAVRAGGYAKLGNFQQVWLEPFESYDPTRNYGVVRGGYAVGIVVEERGMPLMILGGDRGCTFAVYVGDARAPGIATGRDARHMVVRYIPEWMKVGPGDEVFTSGLDRLFPMGIPVGRVLSIRKMQGFKDAVIELYGDTLHPDFVWVVSR
ncbi:rod shape-determining protein MreC [Hydrogenimonas sp.]